ncbi:aminotransferase class I and II [Phlyctema vagabunda]|uniref:Aspartate aminotransferase n=1 Tax=Phlyctema vagabunda TaxID=108571 RepID=A0ABR4P5C4_9HELO
MGSIGKVSSAFTHAEFIPADSIFDVTKRFLADADPQKVNVGAGTYRNENGKPWILPCVRMAKEVVANHGHEYLPISGLKQFREKAVELVLHDTDVFAEERIASCQSLSGTGALLLAGLTLKKSSPSIKNVYITEPTWSNHELLFQSMGFAVQKLPYYKAGAFDYSSYMATLTQAVPGSIIVLHSCAHNPTGCDPSQDQWKEIAAAVRERELFPIFDSAYLGFNSGSVDEDAWAIRYFVCELKLEASICLSFAKSMGLYGERIGLTAFVLHSVETTRVVNSILENVQRATVSTPPVYGANIAATVLSDPKIKEQWKKDLVTMSGRVKSMRQKLYSELKRLETPGDWSHIVKQSGMFGYTGLTVAQIKHLEAQYHIYMADTSRISIAGLNDGNVEYFAQAIDQTVRSVN